MSKLQVKKLSSLGRLPVKQHIDDAGYDLYSAEKKSIKCGQSATVKTDIAIMCPKGTYGRIVSRSGLAFKHGLDVAAGTIDGGYRGNVCILLRNHGNCTYEIAEGDKIAQLILERYEDVSVEEVEQLPSSDRGIKGFGSTGQ